MISEKGFIYQDSKYFNYSLLEKREDILLLNDKSEYIFLRYISSEQYENCWTKEAKTEVEIICKAYLYFDGFRHVYTGINGEGYSFYGLYDLSECLLKLIEIQKEKCKSEDL